MRDSNSNRRVAARIRSRIEIRSVPAEIDVARAWLRRACDARLAVPERWIEDLELAMVEAIGNVIEHAYGHEPDRPIVVELAFHPYCVEVRVLDEGEAFPGADQPPPLPPESAEGGRGLFLMHALTDRVRHTREPDGRNCVTLTKNL